MKKIALGLLVILGIWATFGSPVSMLANSLWSDSPAPWEEVNAYYYPDASDLTQHKERNDVGSVEACRDWVYDVAADNDDPNLERGDYECGVGCRITDIGFNVCRLTVE